jgi:hypothetical protein
LAAAAATLEKAARQGTYIVNDVAAVRLAWQETRQHNAVRSHVASINMATAEEPRAHSRLNSGG